MVASLDPACFEAVCAWVQLGRQGGVTLAGSDLNVRARVIGGEAKGMGSSIGAGSPVARADLPVAPTSAPARSTASTTSTRTGASAATR